MKEDSIKDVSNDTESNTSYVLWSGGFDSTALLLRRLREGKDVVPIIIKPSFGQTTKTSNTEEHARKRIKEALDHGTRKRLKPPIIFQDEQLSMPPTAKLLFETNLLLAEALNLGGQWGVIRFCYQVSNWAASIPIEIGIVRGDEPEKRLNELPEEHPYQKFFKGFTFPLLNEGKRELWTKAGLGDQAILKLTTTCENPNNNLQSCTESDVDIEDWCLSCRNHPAYMMW